MKQKLPITEGDLRTRLTTQTVREIAADLGYERTRIYRKIDEFGIDLPPRRYRPQYDPNEYASDWLTDPVKHRAWSYLLGVYLGDGCVTTHRDRAGYGRPVFRLNTIDADFREATRKALMVLTPYKITCSPAHKVKGSSNPNYPLLCGDPELCKRLIDATNAKRKLPDLPAEVHREFIAGLMDSEGFVAEQRRRISNRRFHMGFGITFAESDDPWIYEFCELLRGSGLKVGKIGTKPPRKKGYRIGYRFGINIQSWIDAGCYFNIRRKQSRIEEWASISPRPRGRPRTEHHF